MSFSLHRSGLRHYLTLSSGHTHIHIPIDVGLFRSTAVMSPQMRPPIFATPFLVSSCLLGKSFSYVTVKVCQMVTKTVEALKCVQAEQFDLKNPNKHECPQVRTEVSYPCSDFLPFYPTAPGLLTL